MKVMELQKKLEFLSARLINGNISWHSCKNITKRDEKSYKSTLIWPPHIQNLEVDQTVIPMYLNRFLCKLFKDSNSKKHIRLNSIGQEILNTLINDPF